MQKTTNIPLSILLKIAEEMINEGNFKDANGILNALAASDKHGIEYTTSEQLEIGKINAIFIHKYVGRNK